MEPGMKYGFNPSTSPQDAQDLMRRKMKEVEDFGNLALNKKWEDKGVTKGVRFWTFSDSHYFVFKTDMDINLPLETVIRYADDLEFRKQYDDGMKSCQIITDYKDGLRIFRYMIKGQWPVSERDFVMLQANYFKDKDTYCSYACDASCYNYPEEKGVVRAECYFTSTTFTRKDANTTNCVTVSRTDPRIKAIPQFILNTKTKEIAMQCLGFKEKSEQAEKARRG